MVFAYFGQISTVDPSQSTYNQANGVISTVYDRLMTYDPQNNLTGSLVSDFTYSNDATSLVLTLRDGVTFHDGAKLTAQDVKYTLDRDASLGAGIAGLISSYSSSEVTGPLQVTIHLKRPDSVFAAALTRVFVVNSALVAQNAGSDKAQAWLSNHDAGSGPFALTVGSEAENITVTRFAGYWRFDARRPAKIVFRRIDLSSTQAQEVRVGTVDITTPLAVVDAKALNGAPGVTVVTLDPGIQTYVFFNMVSGPTTNPAVRKAIQLAFDYQGALSNIVGGNGKVATGVLPLGMPCSPGDPPYVQNVEEAKRTLAAAGINAPTLTMRYQTSQSAWTDAATLMQSNLKQIGITLELQPITFPEYLSALSDRNKIPQMMMLDDAPPFPDPGSMLVPYYSSTAIGTNRSGYADPQVDQLLSHALATRDRTQICNDYKQVQTILYKAAASVNLYTVYKLYGVRSGIEGVRLDRLGGSFPSLSDVRVQ